MTFRDDVHVGRKYRLRSGHVETIPDFRPTLPGIKKKNQWLHGLFLAEALRRGEVFAHDMYAAREFRKFADMSDGDWGSMFDFVFMDSEEVE